MLVSTAQLREGILRTPLTKALHELVIVLLTLDLVLAVEGHAAGRPGGREAREHRDEEEGSWCGRSAAPAYKPSQVLRLSPLSRSTSPPAPEREVLGVL